MRDTTKPRFGTGMSGRPLVSERDFVAELIRRTLRRAGHKECRDWPVRQGVAVEGGNNSKGDGPGHFIVVCTADNTLHGPNIRRYRATLVKAGWAVGIDDEGRMIVDATQPLNDPPRWLRRAFARQDKYGNG